MKSPPELWAECSDAASLARHLGQFGEIRITRLEPETAVAWEGEEISGTVRLEPTGWGTKVILTARHQDADAPPPEEPAAALPEPPRWETQTPPEQPPAEDQIMPEPAPAAQLIPPELEPTQPASEPPRSAKRGAWAWLRDFFGFGPAPDLVVLEPLPAQTAESTRQDEDELLPPPVTEPGPEPEPTRIASAEPVDAAVPSAEEAVPVAEEAVPVAAEAVSAADEALSAALDSLGQAHRRPFSRG